MFFSNGNSNIKKRHFLLIQTVINKIWSKNLKKGRRFEKVHYSGEPKKEKYSGKILYKNVLLEHECNLNANFVLYEHLPMICMIGINNFMYSWCIFHMYLYRWRLLRFLANIYICWPIIVKLASVCKSEKETHFTSRTFLNLLQQRYGNYYSHGKAVYYSNV